MKIALQSYSFSNLIKKGVENQISIIKKAKDLGFDAMDYTELTPHDGSTKLEYAKKIKAECEKYGLVVACYAVGTDMLGKNVDEEVERLKGEIDIASVLGASVLRHDLAFAFPEGTRKYKGFDNVLPIFVDACRKITEYAKTKGIKTCVENHGTFCQDSDRMEKIVNTVADENFGLLIDTGNFLCADEDPIKAVSRCAPYAFHVHIKDFIYKANTGYEFGEGFFRSRGGAYLRGTVAGHGVVPLVQCVSALKLAGYDGYLTLEFEGAEDIEYALASGAKYIRYLSQIQ